MYNGIGLPSPRGSGTSGYIQRNLSTLPRRLDDTRVKQGAKVDAPRQDLDPALAEHELLRLVEVKLAELSMELEEAGKTAEEIEDILEEERKKIAKQQETKTPQTETKKEKETSNEHGNRKPLSSGRRYLNRDTDREKPSQSESYGDNRRSMPVRRFRNDSPPSQYNRGSSPVRRIPRFRDERRNRSPYPNEDSSSPRDRRRDDSSSHYHESRQPRQSRRN